MTRLLASTALVLSMALPAQALDLSQMSEAEREAFGAQVREYLLENPQVIMEAVAVLEERQQAEQANADVELIAANHAAIFEDGHSWVGGNPEGDITLVEFLDYRCGYCKRAFDDVHKLVSSDGNIRLILKEFPILGEGSVLASRFAIATKQVAGDEAYKTLHDALMVFDGDMSETALTRLATSFGLDGEAILAQIDSDEVTAVIAANHALAQEMGISGTPSFVMGDGMMLRGYVPLEGMQQIVAEIREKG